MPATRYYYATFITLLRLLRCYASIAAAADACHAPPCHAVVAIFTPLFCFFFFAATPCHDFLLIFADAAAIFTPRCFFDAAAAFAARHIFLRFRHAFCR